MQDRQPEMCERFQRSRTSGGLRIEHAFVTALPCPLGAAFESVSIAAMRRGGGASWNEAMVKAHGAQASFTMIQRLGYRIYPLEKLYCMQIWRGYRPAYYGPCREFLRELLATASNECHALINVLLASASRDGSANLVIATAAIKPEQK